MNIVTMSNQSINTGVIWQGKNVIKVSYSKWKGILKQFLYFALEKILNRVEET